MIELFASCHCEIAENPLWSLAERKLYWKGMEGEIYRKSPGAAVDDFERFDLGFGIGGMAFTRSGALLLFGEHGRVWRWTPGARPVQVAELPGAGAGTLFNDVIADPEGRVFCGALAEHFFGPGKRGEHGSLWRFDPDGSFHCPEPATGTIPNGMGFSPDRRRFYFAVSDESTIYQYDYDLATGALSHRIALIKGGCDGMTVDAEGCLWVAPWGPSLRRYSPAGELLLEFPLPVQAASSLTFGGDDFQDIFITTADHPKGDPNAKPDDGAVFSWRQSVRGVPKFLAADPQLS